MPILRLIKPTFASGLSLCLALLPMAASAAPAASQLPGGIPLPPARIGSVTEAYEASPGASRVILIQDLHSSREVQRNIQTLLSFYDRQVAGLRIGVEGASGPLNYSTLAADAYPRKAELIDFLRDSGELTGSEAFAIAENRPQSLTGLEQSKFFRFHLELFRRSHDDRMALHGALERLQERLSTLGRLLLPRHRHAELLKRLDAARRELGGLQALLRQQVTLEEARAIVGRLPESIAMLQSLVPALHLQSPIPASEIEAAVRESLDFYAAAIVRDAPLALNMQQLIGPRGAGVMVAGGFHTAGITREFKKAGVSYVVITPQIRRLTQEEDRQYMERLLGREVTDAQIDAAACRALGLVDGVSSTLVQRIKDRWDWAGRQLPRYGFPRRGAGLSHVVSSEQGGGAGESHPARHEELKLYKKTIKMIELRIHEYADKMGRTFNSIQDLRTPILVPQLEGKDQELDPVKEMSSFANRHGLDPKKDYEVAPIRLWLRPADVPMPQQKQIIRKLLRGEILHQFLFAGEASRLKSAIQKAGIKLAPGELDAIYLMDLGNLAGLPRTMAAGPLMLLQLRYTVEKLARENPELGIAPEEALANQPLLLHINSKTDLMIREDLRRHGFYGFNRRSTVFLPQYVGHPFDLKDGKLTPAASVEPVAMGHGWAAMESVMEGVAYHYLDGTREYLAGDAYAYFLNMGVKYVHQYRVNDLYNLTPEVIDIPYLTKEILALDSGETNYLARMVSNPHGTKGGIALRLIRKGWEGSSIVLADTLSMSDAATDRFLKDLETRAPYHRFANTFSLSAMRAALREHGIVPDFELKKFKTFTGSGWFINPQYVTGMVVAIPSLKATVIHKEGEVIKDFKDLSTVDTVKEILLAQSDPDIQPGFAELVRHYMDLNENPQTYRPWQVTLASVGLLAASAAAFLSGLPIVGSLLLAIVGLKQGWLIGRVGVLGIFRSSPVETIDLETGVVTGLTGLAPTAHALRSHRAFQVRNEVIAHLLDLLTIPVEFVHSVVTVILVKLAPAEVLETVREEQQALSDALGSETAARWMPSGSRTVQEISYDVSGRVVPGAIRAVAPLVPSGLTNRLKALLGFNQTEDRLLSAAYQALQSAA